MSEHFSLLSRKTVSQTHSLLAKVLATQRKFPKLERSIATFLKTSSLATHTTRKSAGRIAACSARGLCCESGERTLAARTERRIETMATAATLPTKPVRSESLGLMVQAKRKKINTGFPSRFWLSPLKPEQSAPLQGRFSHACTQAHESSYESSVDEFPPIHSRHKPAMSLPSIEASVLAYAQRKSSPTARLKPETRRLL